MRLLRIGARRGPKRRVNSAMNYRQGTLGEILHLSHGEAV
jgi:hypothetical protein